jgi:hypothetical protein
MHEALLWRMLKHQNILPLLGIYTVDLPSIGRAIPTFYMVSEWMEHGTVRDYLSSGMADCNDKVKLLVRLDDTYCYRALLTFPAILYGPFSSKILRMDSLICTVSQLFTGIFVE